MLPDRWAVRPTTEADADDLLALVHVCDIAAVGFPDFDPEDVAAGLAGPASVVATGPDREIMAWGFLDNSTQGQRDFLEVYARPEGGLPAQRPLLSHLLKQVTLRGTYARAAAVPKETDWIASLEAAGFMFIKQYARMGIDLPAPPHAAPEGVSVRPVRQEELPEFHRIIDTAFRDTPDFQPWTFDQWRGRFIDGHEVHWDEWLVAVVDGQLAGVLQSKVGESAEGWVRNLAVLREFRRRGVGRALLSEAFRAFERKGYSKAGLGVDLANPTEAIRLYTGVGMEPAYQANIYERR